MTGCWRRWIAAGIFGILVLTSGAVPADAAPSLAALEDELHNVHVNLLADEARATSLQQQATILNAQLQAVNAQLGQTQQKITATQIEVKNTEATMGRTTAHLDRTRRSMQKEQRGLRGVLLFAEQAGPLGYLSVLLSVHSFSEFVTQIGTMAQVASYQRGVVNQLQQEAAAISHDLATLSHNRTVLHHQEATLLSQKAHLAQVATQRASVLSQLHQEQASVAAVESNLKSQGQTLWNAIKQLEAELASGKLTASQLFSIVRSLSAVYGVDPYLIMAVIRQESGGNSKAVSSAGAVGLMQLMPQTAADLGVTDPLNPQQNVRGGIAYLAYLLKLFNGNVAWALAGYNAGPGAVEYYHGIPPYPQTQNYVRNILYMYHHGI
ncbi:MAG: transglycosylase SLT domain-containing protein [Thermaerobacter sp.]|nr:transglycosylase SLT domain-containing protein [Thermaerobacter sp.]